MDLTLLGLLLIAAFTLRAWSPGRMAIEHFDEGVYASNLFSDPIEFTQLSYPDRHYYAPPLWPKILEWVLIFTGANPHAVMWVNVFLGTALVAAVWWTTRELVAQKGDSLTTSLAALSAASLIAFSDIFIQYSRTALTDIPVSLWMTLAVGTGARAYRTGSWWGAVTAGLLTGLAWWTKYNGWLPLAILGSGLLGWLLLTAAGRRSFFVLHITSPAPDSRKGKPQKPKSSSLPVNAEPGGVKRLILWGIMVGVAWLAWLPYLNSLQSKGGYSAVAQNHQGYVVGLSGWWNSAVRHLAVDHFYSHWSSATGLLVAFGICWWRSNSTLRNQSPDQKSFWSKSVPVVAAFVCFLTIMSLGLIPVLMAGAVVVPICTVYWSLKSTGSPTAPPLGWWILLAWIAGLTLATPMYRPYPRLILPWMISMIMAAGLGLAHCFQFRKLQSLSSEPVSPRLSPLAAGAALGGIVATIFGITASSPRWLEDRNGLKRGAEAIESAIREDLRLHPELASTLPDLDCVIYVLAEPGLFYQLASRKDASLNDIIQPAANLGMLDSGKIDSRVPAYLITGLHAQEETSVLADLSSAVRSVGDVSYIPSSVVLLDDLSPTDKRVTSPSEVPLRIWAILR